jgi:hypothetical protein
MGSHFNPNNKEFFESTHSNIYVDHSMLIEYTNDIMNTNLKWVCVSRPRRFGKSTDAKMLIAYYSKGCDSSELFNDLKMSQVSSYQEHLNKHNVIFLNMRDFFVKYHNINEMISLINKKVLWELLPDYSNCRFFDETDLQEVLSDIYSQTNEDFIFIIDEWDCVLRDNKVTFDEQKIYLKYLETLLKDKPYVALAYMTGILPIKKYGDQSAINMFKEISFINSTPLESFTGFTETEVKELCGQHDMDFEMMKEWYNGYKMSEDISVYNPRSVVYSIEDRKYGNYWTGTETYESVKTYINTNFDGLKEAIIKLLANEYVSVNTTSFLNDIRSYSSRDDILTLLIHLGYLGYIDGKAYIPNKEVYDEFVVALRNSSWDYVTESLKNSEDLLEAIMNQKEEKVAEYIEKTHLETSIIQYNDENALAYTLYIAMYIARKDYTFVRELPTGEGFADLVLIPKHNRKVPAMIIELKRDKKAITAINQIKDKKYYFGLEDYLDDLLLVGISYDKKTKKHQCIIEKYQS